MAVLLPVLCFAFTLIALVRRQPQADPRRSFLNAAVIWGCLVTFITEGLSPFGQLTATALTVSWLGACVIAGVAAVWPRRISEQVSWLRWPQLTSLEIALCGSIALILGITGIIALLSPPNTWDSMTYHMARVAHWIQDRDLRFWPTPFHPQLHNPPWAEYALLHLTLLTGNDRLVNLVQWFSMAGSLLGVSLIAAQLGADRRGQIASSFFCATLPMGILQSTSTQNDYVAAFWLVCLVHYILELRPAWTLANVLGAGASLGLALLTKGTCFVFAAPLLLGLVIVGRQEWLYRFARGTACLGAVLLVAAVMNTPQSVRNFHLYGECLVDAESMEPGQPRQYQYKNDSYSARVLASNLCRNVALQLATPWNRGNIWVEQAVCAVHQLVLGIDVSDPGTTFGALRFEVRSYPGHTHHEDSAGYLPHLLLLGTLAVGSGVVGGTAVWRGRGSVGAVAGLSGAVVLAFLCFCLTIRWQPFHCRLHLPLFVLLAPVAGVGLARLRSPGLLLVTLLLGGWAIPYLVYNDARPLWGSGNVRKTARVSQYFRGYPALEPSYVGATAFLRQRGYREVGLLFDFNEWEYPLWMLLTDFDPQQCRVEHLAYGELAARATNNQTAFSPPALVLVNHCPPPVKLEVRGRTYRLAWLGEKLTVYLAAGEPNNANFLAMHNDKLTASSRRYLTALGCQQQSEHQTALIVKDYRQYLGRAPSSTELADGVSSLHNGLTETQFRSQLLGSPEFYGRAGNSDRAWLNAASIDLLGRPAEATDWLTQLNNGVSKAEVALRIATSPAGQRRHVQSCLEHYLGRIVSAEETVYWFNEREQGATDEELIAEILSLDGYYTQTGNTDQAWVSAVYRELFNRPADAGEEAHWLRQLAAEE